MNYRGAKINVNGAVSTEELHSAWLQLQQLKLRGQTYFKGKGIRVVSGDFVLSARPFPCIFAIRKKNGAVLLSLKLPSSNKLPVNTLQGESPNTSI